MQQRKLISCVLCVLIMMLTGISSFTTYAEELEQPTQSEAENEVITSVGLISSFALSITGGTKKIYITADVYATDTMAKVGFTDVSIQRSANGYSGWVEEKPLNDDLAQNTYFHKKTNEQQSVVGGYYYRVVLNHYAKETGWFFPSSESITNYSNVVWIPAS